jgi:hypothetical protein
MQGLFTAVAFAGQDRTALDRAGQEHTAKAVWPPEVSQVLQAETVQVGVVLQAAAVCMLSFCSETVWTDVSPAGIVVEGVQGQLLHVSHAGSSRLRPHKGFHRAKAVHRSGAEVAQQSRNVVWSCRCQLQA